MRNARENPEEARLAAYRQSMESYRHQEREDDDRGMCLGCGTIHEEAICPVCQGDSKEPL